MNTVDQQVEARFAQHEERMRQMKTEMQDVRNDLQSLRLALEGNKALGMKGMVDTLSEVYKLARDTSESVSKAKWVLIGAVAAGQGVVFILEKAFGLK